MKIILLERIQNLGEIGGVIEVKPGYARNYLLPQGKAKIATEENIKIVEAQKAELAKRSADAVAYAQALADKVAGVEVVLLRKESTDGNLYGSVNNHDISVALNEMGFEIEKKHIQLDGGAFRTLGEFPVNIIIQNDITAEIKLIIQPEPSE